MEGEFKKPVKPVPAAELKNRRQEEEVLQKQPAELTGNLSADLKLLRSLLHDSSDVVVRQIRLPAERDVELALIYVDGLADKRVVDLDILQGLMHLARIQGFLDRLSKGNTLEVIQAHLLTIGEIKVMAEVKKIIHSLLSGDTFMLVENAAQGLIINTRGYETCGVQEPTIEAVVRGPREGFSESLRTNVSLLRRRIKDPDLVVEMLTVGDRTQTDVALVYIKDLANVKLVKEIKGRIEKLRTDAILESGYIEQMLQDRSLTVFPQMQGTERPDKVAAGILEGRVAIIVDGTPFVLLAPAVWAQFFQSPEDFYERAQIGTFIRFIRLVAMASSLLLPSTYIALASFHPEMLPTSLALALAAARTGVPFSLLTETLLMEIAVEIVREASVRLPGPVGPTVGIVGGLILGEASVRAGIVSPLTVIIVAITAIGSFATPSYSSAIALRLLRFPFMFLAASFGLIGISAGLILLTIHVASLESIGVPYLAPYAPFHLEAQGDAIPRRSWPYLKERPTFLKPQDVERLPDDVGKEDTSDEQEE
ncbi:MAG TPA: spore germination protein [Firmicutes bacterium]|nr:spore germination protein [Bacillota bacterium]